MIVFKGYFTYAFKKDEPGRLSYPSCPKDGETLIAVIDSVTRVSKTNFVISKILLYFKGEMFCTKLTNIMLPLKQNVHDLDCKKKVSEESDGTWKCEKCQQNYPAPNYRYILSCTCVDHTGSLVCTAFQVRHPFVREF